MAPIDKAKKATCRKTANDSGRVRSSTSQNATPTVAVSIHTPSVILTAAQARRAVKEKKYAGQTDEEILEIQASHAPEHDLKTPRATSATTSSPAHPLLTKTKDLSSIMPVVIADWQAFCNVTDVTFVVYPHIPSSTLGQSDVSPCKDTDARPSWKNILWNSTTKEEMVEHSAARGDNSVSEMHLEAAGTVEALGMAQPQPNFLLQWVLAPHDVSSSPSGGDSSGVERCALSIRPSRASPCGAAMYRHSASKEDGTFGAFEREEGVGDVAGVGVIRVHGVKTRAHISAVFTFTEILAMHTFSFLLMSVTPALRSALIRDFSDETFKKRKIWTLEALRPV
ncbi:hypothetical protein EV421DRAFT_1740714 [Armillaria borealis]|uniref:Uncharacterized protein n=1 Tax=Armillaria borealis TaxID=47425 RepID=A0AA39J4J6_9AGAR|nr:hypothetical protein EV421DRAFT_1740714 [Armillaria borealis]